MLPNADHGKSLSRCIEYLHQMTADERRFFYGYEQEGNAIEGRREASR